MVLVVENEVVARKRSNKKVEECLEFYDREDTHLIEKYKCVYIKVLTCNNLYVCICHKETKMCPFHFFFVPFVRTLSYTLKLFMKRVISMFSISWHHLAVNFDRRYARTPITMKPTNNFHIIVTIKIHDIVSKYDRIFTRR